MANNKPSSASATMECEAACILAEILIAVSFSSDPCQPSIILVAKSATSLNLTWTFSNITDTYTLEWQKIGCLAENQENSGSITTNDTS